jgi:hydrogenase/urease accessory protein HupE
LQYQSILENIYSAIIAQLLSEIVNLASHQFVKHAMSIVIGVFLPIFGLPSLIIHFTVCIAQYIPALNKLCIVVLNCVKTLKLIEQIILRISQ